MRGILVKGAHGGSISNEKVKYKSQNFLFHHRGSETPQFIPQDKIQKDSSGKPKYRNYTVGELVRGCHGEAIFYADGQCQVISQSQTLSSYDHFYSFQFQCDNKGNPKNMNIAGVDPNIQKKIGETCDALNRDAIYPPSKYVLLFFSVRCMRGGDQREGNACGEANCLR